MLLLLLFAPNPREISAGVAVLALVPKGASLSFTQIQAGTIVLRLLPNGADVQVTPVPPGETPPTSDAIREALGLVSHGPRARVVTLTPARVVRTSYSPTSVALSGSVTYDRTRAVRRSASLSLVDRDGTLAPRADGDEWAPGELFAVDRGLRVGDGELWTLLGTFEVQTFGSAMAGTLSVAAEDPSHALLQPMGDVLTLSAGMSAEDALRALWEPILGAGSWDLDGGGASLGTARSFAEDDERLAATLALMADLGLEAYMDRSGRPVLRPLADPNTLPVSHTFRQVAGEARAMSLSREGDRRPYNRQVVVGEPPDLPVVRAVADITDPASPIHADRIGLHVAPIHRSAQITNLGQAFAVARALLTAEALWTDRVDWSGIPDSTVEVGQVVELAEARTGTSGLYIVDRLSLPVTTGEMGFTASRLMPLFAEAA